METLHNHNFFYYLESIWKKELHNELKDQWFYAGDESDYQQNDIILQGVEHRRQHYAPTIGEPLKFYDWFGLKGISLFVDYIKTNSLSSRFHFELESLFKLQQSLVITILHNQLTGSLDLTVFHSYLITIRKRLENFRPETLPPDRHIETFNSVLNTVKGNINNTIHELLLKSGYVEIDVTPSILTPKEREALLTQIYNFDIEDNRFIVKTPISHADFLDYFSGIHKRRSRKFQFNFECKNNEAAIVLSKIKDLGFPVSYDEIEKEKVFLHQKKSHLTASYISKTVSLSRKTNSPRTLDRINQFFHDLKTQYFYRKG